MGRCGMVFKNSSAVIFGLGASGLFRVDYSHLVFAQYPVYFLSERSIKVRVTFLTSISKLSSYYRHDSMGHME